MVSYGVNSMSTQKWVGVTLSRPEIRPQEMRTDIAMDRSSYSVFTVICRLAVVSGSIDSRALVAGLSGNHCAKHHKQWQLFVLSLLYSVTVH